MPPQEYITRAEAELLMTQMLAAYERQAVLPRHAETQGELREIKAGQKAIEEIVSEGRGVMKTVGFFAKVASVFLTLASICWIVMQIVSAVRHG